MRKARSTHCVGIVGLGVVGSACKFGFEKLGHRVVSHDTKDENSKLADVLDSDIVFICVPTPVAQDGTCNTSVVEQVVQDLTSLQYKGVIAIKSTVTPGTTRRLKSTHDLKKICFVPEFLRERCAISDFVEHHDLLAIGCESEDVFQLVKEVHGSYPKKCIRMGISEAESLKYFSNIFNALRIIFANEFYELCEKLDISYAEVKTAYIELGAVPDKYLDVNDNFRGYGGVCLPKDVKAIATLIKNLGLDYRLIQTIDRENEKYKTTVFEGMRK
jgi:UDPglucose 6-dehydrogenase